jgi:molybdopterin molybdotransferase
MISFEKALNIVLESSKPLQVETVDILSATGRVLAQNLHADIDQPPFDKSGMDGFACKRTDLGKKLEVVESILAGDIPKTQVTLGKAVRIMTGAPVPAGVDTVFVLEDSKEETGFVTFVGEKTKDNIIKKGELVAKGDKVVNSGTLLDSRHVPLLAAFGKPEFSVYKKAKVGVISTGNELVEPNTFPVDSKIRNTNSYAIYSHAVKVGATPKYYGIAPDNYEATEQLFKKAFSENDVVIFSGGASKGDLDFVGDVIEKNCNLQFNGIGLKPGRPTIFGVSEDKYVFGLPGNPVAVFAVFELLVKPLLYKIMGHDFSPKNIRMPLAEDVKNKNPDRDRLVPVYLKDGKVFGLSYKGSSHSSCLLEADGFITIPEGIGQKKQGELVDVRQI